MQHAIIYRYYKTKFLQLHTAIANKTKDQLQRLDSRMICSRLYKLLLVSDTIFVFIRWKYIEQL